MNIKSFLIFAILATVFLSLPLKNINASTGISVALDKSSPASGNVSAGQTYPLAVFKLTNTAYQTTRISKLTFYTIGTAGPSAIKSVRATILNTLGQAGVNTDLSSSIVNSDGSVSFDLPSIGSGEGITLSSSLNVPTMIVKLDATFTDAAQIGATIGLSVNSKDDIGAVYAVPFVGSFPVAGNLMTFAPLTTGTQSITLTYPTDKKITWQWNKTYTIKWTAINVDAPVYVYLIDNIRGQTQTIAGPLMANIGSFEFSLSDKFPVGGKYQIKVGNDSVSDTSKNYFKITIPAKYYAPYFAISSPSAGEILQPDKPYTIKWTAGNWNNDIADLGDGSSVRIHDIVFTSYDDAHTVSYSIPKKTSGNGVETGSFLWKVPGNKNFYKNNKITITITEYDPMGALWVYNSFDSGVFSIAAPASCTPNWKCSAWSACSADGQKTRTCADSNLCGTVQGQPDLTQSCEACTPNWKCSNWSACKNRQQTRKCSDANKCGVPLPQDQHPTTQDCTATIIFPAAGSQLEKGKTYDIKWKISDEIIMPISISLVGSGDGYLIAKDIEPSRGSYSWKIPENLPVHSYNIQIEVNGFNDYNSGTFTISAASDQLTATHCDTVAKTCTAAGTGAVCTTDSDCSKISPSITILSPNGGETWYVGETYNITWKSAGIDKVYIYRFTYDESGKLTGKYLLTPGGVPAATGTWPRVFGNAGKSKIYIASTPVGGGGIFSGSAKFFNILPARKTSQSGHNIFSAIGAAFSGIAEQIKSIFLSK